MALMRRMTSDGDHALTGQFCGAAQTTYLRRQCLQALISSLEDDARWQGAPAADALPASGAEKGG